MAPLIGDSVSSGETWNHIHTNNTKGTDELVFVYLNIHCYLMKRAHILLYGSIFISIYPLVKKWGHNFKREQLWWVRGKEWEEERKRKEKGEDYIVIY